MSRISNALKMYLLLQNRNIMSVHELAEILEVSPRMIKEYKNDLEKAGIYINSKRGKYGGYYLENRIQLRGFGITKQEFDALKMANEIISSGNYVFSLDFETFTNKILNFEKDFTYIDYFAKEYLKPEQMKQKEKEIWNIINKAIINKKKILMLYKSLDVDEGKNKVKKRKVHPYGTFEYDRATYFFGYCELREEIRFFKISRIEEIIITEEKFEINDNYNIKEMLSKSFGIIDDDVFYLKLKISYPFSQLVREKQYSINQKITEIDEDTIIFEAELKGYPEVKAWVLSMGSKVEVLEPEKLRKDIDEEIRKLQEIYK